jgi:hypothetical protein
LGSTRAVLLVLLAGCSDAAICASEEFQSALSSGEVVVGACRVDGDFAIDRPVSITGEGAASLLAGNLTIETEGRVEIRGLVIESPSRAAILARGGRLVVSDVTIRTELGAGIALENVQAEISNVTIEGSVDVSSPPALPIDFDVGDAATHGVVAAGGTVALSNVQISGTAAAAALFAGNTVTWNGGRLFDALGIGILGDGATVAIDGLEIEDIVQGFELAPAYGAVFVGSGSSSSTDLRVTGTQGIGLAQIGTSGVHTDLEADANSVAGVWVERGDIELTGAIHDNLFAGFVAVETGSIDVHDATIDRTAKRIRQVELLGSIEVGDGIQVVRPSIETTIRGVTMEGNERTGLLLDLPMQHGTIDLTDLEITVTSSSGAAAVAQGSAPADWDQGVTRNGTDALADQAKAGTLDILGVIAPCDHPRGAGLSGLADIGL